MRVRERERRIECSVFSSVCVRERERERALFFSFVFALCVFALIILPCGCSVCVFTRARETMYESTIERDEGEL